MLQAEVNENSLSADAIKAQANESYKKGCYKDAVDLYSKAIGKIFPPSPIRYQYLTHFSTIDIFIDLDPGNATYYLNRSAAMLMMKKWNGAVQDATKAIKLDSSLIKAYIRASKGFLFSGKLKEALDSLETAKKICIARGSSGSGEKAVVDKEIFTMNRIQQLIQQFQANVDKGAYKDALRNIESAFMVMEPSLQPTSEENGASMLYGAELSQFPRKWLLERGECLLALKELDEASNMANSILRLDSTSSDFLVLRARILYLLDTHPTSSLINFLSQALSYDPDNKKARSFFKNIKALEKIKTGGNDAFKSGDFEVALSKYSEWLDTEPQLMLLSDQSGVGKAKVFSNRASTYAKLGRYNDAIKDCNNAINILVRISFSKKVGENGEAAEHYHPIAKDIQECREVSLFLKIYLRRADCYMKESLCEEAVRDYTLCDGIKPQDAGMFEVYLDY